MIVLVQRLTQPVIIAALPVTGDEPAALLIDGTRRLFKGHATGIAELPAYLLTEAETLAIRVCAEAEAACRDSGRARLPRLGTTGKEPAMTGMITVTFLLRSKQIVQCGSTDRDAEGLEKVLVGVSNRHECVRGESERQSSGCP